MLFSVIIPIFNVEKTLRECLNSVKNQTVADFEVVMIDDGSEDSSGKIAEEFAASDARFRYYCQENSGVSTARNLGISKAKGRFITFLDSDDVYYPAYLQSFAELICEYPNYGHYWCAFEEIDSDSKTKGTVFCYEKTDGLTFSDRENVMTLHSKTMVSTLWNKLYRSEIVQKMRMRPNLSLGEDEIFNFEYLDNNSKTGIVINNIPQYGYRCTSNDSLNTKYRENLLEIYEEMNSAEEAFIQKWQLPEQERERFCVVKYYRFERTLWNTFNAKNSMTYREKYQYNNAILHSAQFQNCLNCMDGKMNRLFYIAYKLKHFEIVMLLSKAAKIKSNMRKSDNGTIRKILHRNNR